MALPVHFTHATSAEHPRLQADTHLSPSFLSMSSLNLCAPPPVALISLVSVLTK